MYKNKVSLLVLSLLFLAQFAVAQNNTNSPYTRFGFGDISDTNAGEQRAMGGVAIGSRANYSINTVNPASYSAVDSMTFMFDIGVSPLISRFSNASGSKTTYNANLEYITMQFPLAKNIGFSAGLLPYSFAGYNFYRNDTLYTGIKDFDTIPNRTKFWGQGGFSQVYAGLSANLFNHVSLGLNAYYMYGSVDNNRSMRLTNASDSTVQYNTITAKSFRFRYGAQFYNTFAKKHDVTLGLIYEQGAKLNGSFSQITNSVLSETTVASKNDSVFELPTMFGVGLYYTYDKRLSIGLDYTLQEWKNAKFFGKTDSLSNRSKIALGVEYLPNPRGRKFAERIRYRAGFNMSDSYYKVNGGIQPKNYGLSLGVGLPLYNNVTNTVTMLNASVEYGKIGATNLLREDYFKFTLNVAFNEHWFFKRKL
ncbi:MAG: hypothetical protein PHR83_10895 [Paludibacter sp.]|nr:hypothetical protein [Paludibacter sp.]